MSHGTGWGEGFWNTKKALEIYVCANVNCKL